MAIKATNVKSNTVTAIVSVKPPVVKTEIRVYNGFTPSSTKNVIKQGYHYTGTHSDGIAIARYGQGVMWYALQGPDFQGYMYIDVATGNKELY